MFYCRGDPTTWTRKGSILHVSECDWCWGVSYPKTVDGGIMFSWGVNREEKRLNRLFLFRLDWWTVSHFCSVPSSILFIIGEGRREESIYRDEWASFAAAYLLVRWHLNCSGQKGPKCILLCNIFARFLCYGMGVLNSPDDVESVRYAVCLMILEPGKGVI